MTKTKTAVVVVPVQVAFSVKPCCTCWWSVAEGNGTARCHANPPQIRLPYENMASWPVVPIKGGGCRLHKDRV